MLLFASVDKNVKKAHVPKSPEYGITTRPVRKNLTTENKLVKLENSCGGNRLDRASVPFWKVVPDVLQKRIGMLCVLYTTRAFEIVCMEAFRIENLVLKLYFRELQSQIQVPVMDYGSPGVLSLECDSERKLFSAGYEHLLFHSATKSMRRTTLVVYILHMVLHNCFLCHISGTLLRLRIPLLHLWPFYRNWEGSLRIATER